MHLMNLSKVCQKKQMHILLLYVFIGGNVSSLSLFFFPAILFILFLDVKYAVKDITEGTEYEFRVSAINESGSGDPSPPSEMVCAKNPNSK